ncbi:MAG: SusC/RagA family TonB-linked outer membrane protein [Phaeodactylibacter sp.]|nr:SusC/RagA family TonB-linked outer membrane protein [Phaeodactylibacter sp.]MCB9050901.1 SusC/RagA family TonB-linked outer membrane protein [Lewinellaceae bacterium]
MKLKTIQKATKVLAALGVILLLGAADLQAQTFTLNGTVASADGEPLVGATIYVEGAASQGTVTDFEGAYTLSIPASNQMVTVVYSYIGYGAARRQVTPSAGGKETVDVILAEDYIGLEQVVVTGASTATSKKRLGNAISTLDARDITNSGATSLDQALAGKITGALVSQNSGNPAGGISVTLRGYSTVLGNSNPLYIIDGVIIDNSSNELIDLGGYTQNRLVDLNPNDIERVEIIKGAAAAAVYGSRASNGVVQIFTKKGAQGKPRISFSTSFNVNQLRKEIEENMEPFAFEEPANASNPNLVPTTRYKMQDYIFDTGIGTDNTLSMSGGSENTKYYASGAAFYNEGIIKNSDFSRYSARLNVDQILSSWASVSVGLNYIHNNSNEIPNGGIAEVYGALTGFNFNNNNFNPEPDADGNYQSPAGFVANPLEVIDNFKFGQKTQRFIGSTQLRLSPFKGFDIEYILGFDTYTQKAEGFIPVGSNGTPLGWARTAIGTSQLINNDLNLRYTHDISNGVRSQSWLGFTVQHDESTTLAITANRLSPVVQSTDAGTVTSRGDSKSERNIQGAFFQQTFDFGDKLYLTGAIRLDQASPFGENERTQFYPKASFSYLISEEPFWKEGIPAINTFKVRASYGQSGNLSALRAYERYANYNPQPIGGQTALIPSTRQGNPDIKPERQIEYEFGIDMGLFDNRLGLEFSYYDVEVQDLLLERTNAPSTGFNSRLENVGTMTNKGFELMIRAVPVQARHFNWKLTTTFSQNRNEVAGIEGGLIRLPKSFGISVARNGEPLGIIDGFFYARDASGNILLDANGLPSRATDENGVVLRKTIADPNPDWIGSLINEFTYKKFSLYLQFDAVQGFEVFNFTDRVNSRSSFGGGFRDAQEIRGELPRGYNNAAYNIWERYIEDGSFIKLRELTLSYNTNPPTPAISNLRIFLQGRNLLSFDDYTGWDPEVSSSGQTNGVRGFDFNEVPIPRTIRFGIGLTL